MITKFKLFEANNSHDIFNMSLKDLKVFLTKNPEFINEQDDESFNSLLHLNLNDYDMVKFLVKMGINTNLQNDDGDTALLKYIYERPLKITNFIINTTYETIKLLLPITDTNIRNFDDEITFWEKLQQKYEDLFNQIIKDFPNEYNNYLKQEKAEDFNI